MLKELGVEEKQKHSVLFVENHSTHWANKQSKTIYWTCKSDVEGCLQPSKSLFGCPHCDTH